MRGGGLGPWQGFYEYCGIISCPDVLLVGPDVERYSRRSRGEGSARISAWRKASLWRLGGFLNQRETLKYESPK